MGLDPGSSRSVVKIPPGESDVQPRLKITRYLTKLLRIGSEQYFYISPISKTPVIDVNK